MSLRYSDKPYYGRQTGATVYAKFPAGARPIATAPAASATPVVIYDADGRGHWCLNHRDGWQKLRPQKDYMSGAVQWRMCGEAVQQPVAWSPQPIQRKR